MAKFYITTPIYYVNDKPHIGHAYTTIAADILARFHRMKGDDVFFLTGTDEHGKKIAQEAEKRGQSPQTFVDEWSATFMEAWDTLGLSHDFFIRTTESRHERIASMLLQKLYDDGFLYKGSYEGLYCVGCEAYKAESELVDGLCPFHKKAPIPLSEENWFFRLSDFTPRIKEKILSKEMRIEPEARRNEVLSFLEQGVKDIPISRKDVPWGIVLPFDREQTCYVWIEALMNYITALDVYENEEHFQKFWPADVQLMAKDILKTFHAVIWPSMLMALGLRVPKKLYAHGFFTIEGQKMSKTLGNVIDPTDWARRYGNDALRYFLFREVTFGQDGDISEKRMKERYTSDLSHGLGNLVSRVFALAEKRPFNADYGGGFEDISTIVCAAWDQYDARMSELRFHEILTVVWDIVSSCDLLIECEKPWQLAKSDAVRFSQVLTSLMECLRHIAWMLFPFMPEVSETMLAAMGVFDREKKSPYANLRKWGTISGEIRAQKFPALFPMLETKQ
ncbi:MAG: methionine--tRNA ligase [Parcubacteria group bacterium]|nr:methionine--tRNA ligase [Parcubacteria group bacterium]